jgi:hypothetical protein
MPRRSVPTLSLSALLAFVGFAAISIACAEGAPLPMQRAIREHAAANLQMEQTVSAISNTARARRARRGVDGGGSARRVRRAFGDAHMSSGFPGDLVGGTFAWPYFNYCRRHNADPNC